MKIDQKAVNNIRVFGAEMISNAKSGHTGIVLSAAPIMYALYTRHLNNSPDNSDNILRDRFVLSAGHGSALLYTMLHFMGYNITFDDLMHFRQIGYKTSGHPERDAKIGVECTTGPLGQGVATAVGMAMGLKRLQAKYNTEDVKLFNNYVYTLVGDGCVMEGISYEALSLAGTLQLDNLIVLYDSNDNTLDSSTSNTYNIDIKAYAKSLNLDYILVKNGNNVDAISLAIAKAKRRHKPVIIEVKTKLGFGSDLENSNKAHGLVMDDMQIAQLRLKLGVNSGFMELEDDVKKHIDSLSKRRNKAKEFDNILNEYSKKHPDKFAELQEELFAPYKPIKDSAVKLDNYHDSTRNIGGEVLNAIVKNNSGVIGGCADLGSCTKAIIKNSGIYNPADYSQDNIYFGIREFAMAAIANGLSLVGFKTFASTFMVFSDYMKSAIRSSAIMKLPVVYILSHDSIAVGEDGCTHQPVEQLATYRAMPNINVFRPSNIEECVEAYNYAFASTTTPSIISLTRQVINLTPTPASERKNISKGAYILAKEQKALKYVILASGSEVQIALGVKDRLEKKGKGVRVVSVPCMELLDKQNPKYLHELLPNEAKIVAIEAGASMSWYKYVGNAGKVFGVNDFGVSGNFASVYEYFGLTIDKIVNAISKM